ncbi:MAG: class I tRNA ligase family protein, partial [Clostridia bacterium]
NRNLTFVEKYFNKTVPSGVLNDEIKQKLSKIFESVGEKIENTHLRDALDEIFELVRFGNKYFDVEKPWKTRTDDVTACENTIFNCIELIANLSILLSPFLPFSSKKVMEWFNLKNQWKIQFINPGYVINKSEILFKRLDKNIISQELDNLNTIISI